MEITKLKPYLTAIKEAIQFKDGTTGNVNVQDMPQMIIDIPSGGGGGITTNEVIRAMDLSRSLIDKNVILTESDYTEENIKIMTDLMDVTVGGI